MWEGWTECAGSNGDVGVGRVGADGLEEIDCLLEDAGVSRDNAALCVMRWSSRILVSAETNTCLCVIKWHAKSGKSLVLRDK